MLRNIYRENTVNCVLNRGLTAVGPFSHNKSHILNSKLFPSDVKSYHEFCTFFGLKQLIKVVTRTAIISSTIFDHVVASYQERVIQCGVIYISLCKRGSFT